MRDKKNGISDRSTKDDNDSDVEIVRVSFNVPIVLNEEMGKKLATSKYATRSELVRSLIRAWLEEPHISQANISDTSEGIKGK